MKYFFYNQEKDDSGIVNSLQRIVYSVKMYICKVVN